MRRIVYCKNCFVREERASVSIFDRGFLFGDAIYEVTAVIDGHLIDNDLHLDRMERSLEKISIPLPLPRAELEQIQAELIKRNNLSEGVIYIQVSRGEADRSFTYSDDLMPNLVMFPQHKKLTETPAQRQGISMALAEDERWARRDIKTCMLLSQVQAKQQALAAGCDDVLLIENGLITEGASSSVFIITSDGQLVIRPNSSATLPGCTRAAVLKLCDQYGLHFVQRVFSPEEAKAAAEVFVTSASSLVTPVVRIGDTMIADGRPGPVTRRLQSCYLETVHSAQSVGLS